MKISEKLRNWCTDFEILGEGDLDNLREMADRIDREMVELPKDVDGVPIRIGDVMYSSGNEDSVVSITIKADETYVGVHTDEGVFLPSVNPNYLSRKNPEPADSFERIADELDKWCDLAEADSIPCDELRELADRIDREMVELPKDKDGETIRIGDVTHDCFIDEDVHIEGIVFKSEWEILTDFGRVKPHWLTHTIPDSLERIAEDIEAAEDWCDREGEYGTGITSVKESTLREWADRIRKLAKEDSENGTD